jgi:hypothetical protein
MCENVGYREVFNALLHKLDWYHDSLASNFQHG